MPPKTQKYLYGEGTSHHMFIDQCKAFKLPYKIISSTYTTHIVNPYIDVLLMQNVMSIKAFQAHKMIERDIKLSGVEMPQIDRDKLSFLDFNIPQKLMNVRSTVYNIDLKSAYATVLTRYNLIAKETAGFLNRLHKTDRLACVGMMASKKNTFFYNGQGILDGQPETLLNPMHGWFDYCIKETENIMNDIRGMVGEDYLFYWVDGIYFQDIKHKKTIQDYLISKGYNNSFDTLNNFTCFKHNKGYNIYFDKEGTEGEKGRKLFRIPSQSNAAAKQLIEYLGLQKPEYGIIRHKH